MLKKSPGGRLEESVAKAYVHQIAGALSFLQECKVIHRDIKVCCNHILAGAVIEAVVVVEE